MGLEARPYIGSWRLRGRSVVSHTPDALVYINGDISVPGCQKCSSKINIQKFVTSVSVDAGCDPAGAQASITLTVPTHHLDSFARDSQFILHPGLEVHVYMRGYFPVKGLYSGLDSPLGVVKVDPDSGAALVQPAEFRASGVAGAISDPTQGGTKTLDPREYGPPEEVTGFEHFNRDKSITGIVIHESTGFTSEGMERTLQSEGYGVHYAVDPNGSQIQYYDPAQVRVNHVTGNSTQTVAVEVVNPYYAKRASGQEVVKGKWVDGGSYAVPPQEQMEATYSAVYHVAEQYGVPLQFPAASGDTFHMTSGGSGAGIKSHQQLGEHADGSFPALYMAIRARGYDSDEAYARARESILTGGRDVPLPPVKGDAIPPAAPSFQQRTPVNTVRKRLKGKALEQSPPPPPEPIVPVTGSDKPVQNPQWGPSMLEGMGLSNMDLENILAYPYYHTFHGVVVQVAHSWSAGAQQITLQCASMLHFWQYHQMSSNASYLGARPKNSKNRMSLLGHNFTGMHPYEIIYTLHHDTAGAAGGVAYHLSQKTNQEARSPITGESLFSLNVRYWERRFNQREIKLRLHGATGGLFNSAQATFLSRLKGSQITDLLKNRFTGKTRRGGSDIYSAAKTLGLMRPVGPGRRASMMKYLSFGGTYEAGSDKPTFELNIAEMIAFVSNISQWGQVQLFESTYESKLDIAQKVCEVTGFEFYQDVDGDFVFKPPMYNLDTSSSRVYRLEDIDIISINFDEKEPQVTYMTCKGTPFKNLAGHGVEGEWGVQGQYIDYRLVAQFGWRPGNFEAAYFNDPRSMFFAAMNRLDVMNAPTKSASVTVPIRPELRPGYPIYIPYLDCFYYCNSFAHSFSAGGQCTTTLQLIGKRGKFYAPGDPAKVKRDPGSMSGGIDAIQLGYTAFPPTPLEVLDGEGRARLSGFPNVVMALDPTQINPVFFLVGSDVDDLNTDEALTGLLKMGVDLNVLTVKDKGDPGPEYKMSADSSNVITFWFPKEGDSQTMPADGLPIRALASEYAAKQEKFSQDQERIRKEQDEVQQKISAAQSQLARTEQAEREQKKDQKSDRDKFTAEIEALNLQLEGIVKRYDDARAEFDNKLADAASAGGAAYLAVLIREIGKRFFKDAQFGVAYKDPNATTTLLDMLSDKKSGLTNANVPGTYRYYSASHPAKEHQGIPPVKVRKTDKQKSKETRTPFVGDEWKDIEVDTYVPTREIQIQPAGVLPQAQLEKRKPIWGIEVLTAQKTGGEFVPTSEIRELMFSTHHTTLSAPTNKSTEGSYTLDVGGSLTGKILEQLKALTSKVSIQLDTPELVFTDWLTGLNSTLQAAATEANKVGSGAGASIKSLTLPTEFLVQGGGVWPATSALSKYQTADTKGADELFDGSSMINAIKIWEAAASWWSGELTSQIRALKDAWWADTRSTTSYEDGTERLSVFLKTIGSRYGTEPSKQKVTTTVRKPPEQPEASYMPVFPVSDSQGYMVIGSYRYGRDVSIDPDGVFDVLAHMDPMSLLDHRLLEKAVDVVTKGQGIYVETPVLDVNGNPKTSATGAPVTEKKLVTGPQAVGEMERQVLRALQKHMTDQQILDLGLAKATDDPTVLQFNLMNWFSEKSKEGVHQIPLVNAGFSLAELSAGITAPTCSCKAAEADVLLEIAGREGFVGISNPGAQPGAPLPLALGNRGVDDVTRLLMESSMAASLDWGMSQDALRGAVPDQKPSSLVQSFKDLGDTFEAQVKRTEAGVDNVAATGKQEWRTANKRVDKAFGG